MDSNASSHNTALIVTWLEQVIQNYARTGGTGAGQLLSDPAFQPLANNPILQEKAGAFVTLRGGRVGPGNLRGCIGRIESSLPLKDTLGDIAIDAAFRDPRFPPVSPDELPKISLEITILSEPRAISSWEQIQPGRHGIILAADGRRALFLPQVASEQGWSLEETLEQLCRKAGLPPRRFREGGVSFRIFEGRVIRP
ncbi:AmmeMemoRadiSam system protein A [Spirochaeta lutea]|uniref:AmmeMemoRadiSam system protein A n=1 Tax=Spirochaeta lutea TaxID=1480694 RepID=UPI00068BA1D5|nr:AmmeMemoRadiSam system protein A [Spirochaeta lutea]